MFDEGEFLYAVTEAVAEMIRKIAGVECLTRKKESFTIRKKKGIKWSQIEKGIMEIFDKEGIPI